MKRAIEQRNMHNEERAIAGFFLYEREEQKWSQQHQPIRGQTRDGDRRLSSWAQGVEKK
jgi:hypothetical protein